MHSPLKRIIAIILALYCLLYILTDVLWLSTGLCILAMCIAVLLKGNGIFARLREAGLLYLAFLLICTVFLAMLPRLFFGEIFTIPSTSMRKSMIPGDIIWMNKLPYGPVMPRSPLEVPLLNHVVAFNAETFNRARNTVWPFYRLKGFSGIQRNDVVIFIKPKEEEEHFIKRCIGLPGEELQIIKGEVHINGMQITEAETVCQLYQVWHNHYFKTLDLLDSLKISVRFRPPSDPPLSIKVSVNETERALLAQSSCIDSLSRITESIDTVKACFPYKEGFFWTIDEFGPLVVPAKGMVIELDHRNFNLYESIITKHEGREIVWKEGKAMIDDREVKEYTFTKDYYFFLGDHRTDSSDSRYWGFVPDTLIVGKATTILMSITPEKFRWDRFMRKII
jgi:signal peptidase I